MTNEEILEKCRKDYPAGTRVHFPPSKTVHTSNGKFKIVDMNNDGKVHVMDGDGGLNCFYSDGTFSTVMKWKDIDEGIWGLLDLPTEPAHYTVILRSNGNTKHNVHFDKSKDNEWVKLYSAWLELEDLGECCEPHCKNKAVTDYNGHGVYVCLNCDDRLSSRFDEEYR